MATYVKIKEIKDKENKNIINVLQYIAEKEGYMSGKSVQYRKLYYYFLREKFLETGKNVDGFVVSIKQYKRLKIYRKGQFPIHTAVYLLTLYKIMYHYKRKADLGDVESDVSYTTYIANELKCEIERFLSLPEIDPLLAQTFQEVYDDFIKLDNDTGRMPIKIYNNIW